MHSRHIHISGLAISAARSEDRAILRVFLPFRGLRPVFPIKKILDWFITRVLSIPLFIQKASAGQGKNPKNTSGTPIPAAHRRLKQ
jgi:hypothetical protein